MAKGRKYGCPVNIRDWLIEILDNSTGEFVRINGLSSMSNSIEGDTEDGSAESAQWAEPYVTKRSGALSLEGKPVVNSTTGVGDLGQELLKQFVRLTGCDADATIRMTDPYGRAAVADYIVTSYEESTESGGSTLSYELELVGEVEMIPYVQVSSVKLSDSKNSPLTELSIKVGDPASLVNIAFDPENSSNKRYKITNSNKNAVSLVNVSENSFSVLPLAIGTAIITVRSVNGDKSAQFNVKVTSAD